MYTCARCKRPVESVWDNGTINIQPKDGLHLVNIYGYGMYRDHHEDQDPRLDIVVCGDGCTEEFLKANPWLKDLIDRGF